jgi:hypothetical protein
VLIFSVRCTDPGESDEECGLLVNEVIEALDRLMDFFYNNLNLLIADGFVGIAIAQGKMFFLRRQRRFVMTRKLLFDLLRLNSKASCLRYRKFVRHLCKSLGKEQPFRFVHAAKLALRSCTHKGNKFSRKSAS